LSIPQPPSPARPSERAAAYAEKVATEAHRIGKADIERLRAAGFTDRQICDIALCASLRCFIGTFADAVGVGPEAAFVDRDAEFRAAMTVGRPLARD
jgi:hypothetical protein